MTILLDTNVYVAFKRGAEEAMHHIRGAERVLLSAVVAGELLFGFRNGSRFERNLREFHAFLDDPHVGFLDVGRTTADRFARIAAQLRRLGRPIPTNDVWIAAHAMESGAELVSYDGHFAAIDGLVWTQLAA